MAYVLTTVVIVLLNLQLLLATAVINQTAPSYSPVCPGDTVIFTCTTDTDDVTWSYIDEDDNHHDVDITISFPSDDSMFEQEPLGPFTLTLINITNNLTVSTATVNKVTNILNGTTIYCFDNGNSEISNIVTLIVRNITSLGPPIGLSVTALNDSTVNLTWSPPLNDSICITGYIITIINSTRNNIPVTISTSTNTLVLSHLYYGVTYNFTVAAVDKRNITGTYSEYVIINLSSTTNSFTPSSSNTLPTTILMTVPSPVPTIILMTTVPSPVSTTISMTVPSSPVPTTLSMTVPSPVPTTISTTITLTSNIVPTSSFSITTSSTIIDTTNNEIIIGAVGGTLSLIVIIIIIIVIVIVAVICCSVVRVKNKTKSTSDNFNLYSTLPTPQQPSNQEVTQLTIPVYAEVNRKKVNEDNIDGFSEATRQVTNIDDVPPPIPPYNPMEGPSYSYEYSEINKQKQKHENAESPELSTSKQGGRVYAEVGDFHNKPPPAVPPPIEVQPVTYSVVMKHSINPPVTSDQMLPDQDDMETLPPPPLPERPPKILKINHL